MYPQRELIRLTAAKAVLQRKIVARRAHCAEAAARAARPLAWLDTMLALWRRLTPLALFAAVPLGWVVTRTVFPRMKMLGKLVRWSPLIFGAVRALSAAIKTRPDSASS